MNLLLLPIPSEGNALYWIDCNGKIDYLRKLNLDTVIESIIDRSECLGHPFY